MRRAGLRALRGERRPHVVLRSRYFGSFQLGRSPIHARRGLGRARSPGDRARGSPFSSGGRGRRARPRRRGSRDRGKLAVRATRCNPGRRARVGSRRRPASRGGRVRGEAVRCRGWKRVDLRCVPRGGPEPSQVRRALRPRGRRHAEGLLPDQALPTGGPVRRRRDRSRLGPNRDHVRVLRPGALEPRVPRVRGHHARRVRAWLRGSPQSRSGAGARGQIRPRRPDRGRAGCSP